MNFFNNIIFKVNSEGYVRVTFLCKKCGKEISEPADFVIPCTHAGVPLYHLTEFICEDCYKKGKRYEL